MKKYTINYEVFPASQLIKIKFVPGVLNFYKDAVEPTVKIFRTMVPASEREYDPLTKTWTFKYDTWINLLAPILECTFNIVNKTPRAGKSFSSVENVHVPEDYAKNFYQGVPVSAPVEERSSIAAQLGAILGIGEAVAELELSELKKKYRAAARQFHPDLGGDPAKMSELNRLWAIYNNTGTKEVN